MIYNKIPVVFGALRNIFGPAVNYQYDVKQILVISGLDLPEYYEVDFCNEGDEQTITMVGSASGVEIPDEFLLDGRNVKGYLVIQGEDAGAVETRYEITIPVNRRPRRSDIEPTPAEQQQIDQLIENMNAAVTRSEAAAETAAAEVEAAGASAEESDKSAQDAEAWAVGQRNGVDVEPTDETYQNNSKFYSELAAQGAEESGYAWFDVHDDDGHMYVYISDNLSEDVSFAIDEFTGHLEVTYH